MEVTKRSVDELSQDPANARVHGKRNIEAIVSSLRAYGQQKPIVVDDNGVVIAGNGTLKAAQELGWKEIDTVTTDLAGTDKVAFAIADNRTAELAQWDDDVLHTVLTGFDKQTREILAYNQSEYDALAKQIQQTEKDTEEGNIPRDFSYRLVVDCKDEEHQAEIMAVLEENNIECRVEMY